jgi:TatA/E family protein of Tat protein translocase
MPFDFGIGEIAIVLVIGLLVFGPKKLPEISRGIGSGMRDFRRGLAGEADAATVETPVAQAAPVAAEAPVTPAEAAPPAAAPASAAPASAPTSTVTSPAE